MKFFCAFVYFLTVSLNLFADGWFSEYWQQFFIKNYENEHIAFKTFVRLETGNHFKNIRVVFLSEQFIYKPCKNTFLEIHYSYIHGHPLSSPRWRWQNRLELEANKTFDLPDKCQVITRNRLEFRWREKIRPYPDLRARQRTMLLVPLKNVMPLKAFSCFNEIFYNISEKYFDQDRICPCQLTFALKEKVDLDVYFIIRFLDENDSLIKSFVIGTQLNF